MKSTNESPRERSSVLVSERTLMIGILSVSLVLNLYQARRLAESRGLAVPPLKVGAPVSPFTGISLTGGVMRVDFRQPTFLYFFSPDCTWCERNWANLRTAAETAARRYRVVAVTTQAVPDNFARDRKITVPIVRIEDATATLLGFRATPATLVVTGSRVTRNWQGAYTGNQGREIESFFAVRLPGLPSLARQAPRSGVQLPH